MWKRLRQYLIAFAILSVLAIAYQLTVTPLMQPPPVETVAMAEDPILQADDSLSDVFPEGSWQLGPCKQLQTAEGMLLFQNWEQTNDDQWKLWPVSVVIGRGMSARRSTAPVILDAAAGAEIKFTESLDVMSGGAPPIDRGRMMGEVHIYRRGEPGEDDPIDIRTANVGIDARKIWTTEAIEMNVGRARMLGRDLTIYLAGPAAPGGSSGNVSTVLDRMELIYLDELVMPLQSGGLWRATAPTAEAPDRTPTAIASDRSAMISIACGGRVEYDFALDQLTLRDSVSLVHHVPGKLADRFDCDALQLTLNDPTNESIQRQSPIDWLTEIIASGDPAVAKLPSFEADLAAERIELNVTKGMIRAEGSKGIQLRRRGISARLARLVYQFDPKQPKAIGVIDAQGAGIVQINDPAIPLRKAQWRDGVKVQPMGRPTSDPLQSSVELWVDGEVHAWMSDGGEFRADSIAGVLKPSIKPGTQEERTLVPDRFEISGDVRIDTTAIAAETKRLLLYFVSEDDPPPQSVAGSEQPEQSSPLRQWVVQPRKPGEIVDPIARPRPTIRGDSIRAQLRRDGSQLSAKKLSVAGSVEVVHRLTAGDQSLPARLTGDQLQLIDGGGEDILQLTSGPGAPARFDVGDGFFIGPQIQVRPSDNLIWMNAAGEFQMPTAALPTGLAGQSQEKIRWAKPPHCRWQGEMIFDGRTAVLTEGVDITAELVNEGEHWNLHMKGDRLQVDLTQAVQVRDMQAMRRAAVQSVALMQSAERPVIVQALRRGTDGVLEARHMLHANQLTLSPDAGGRLVGQGPGWYRGWMIPKSDGPLSGRQNQSAKDPNERSITGIHLVFNDSMQGDLYARKLDFLRGVRVGVRSVESWEAVFDAQKMDAISVGESTLDCDRLRFNVEPGFDNSRRLAGTPTPWEMEANSGVVFRTRNDSGLLEGTASRASYSSSKDLFTVEGAPNEPAIFRQTRADGSAGPEGAVRTMSIRPGTMKVENAVIERLNIATPPQTFRKK